MKTIENTILRYSQNDLDNDVWTCLNLLITSEVPDCNFFLKVSEIQCQQDDEKSGKNEMQWCYVALNLFTLSFNNDFIRFNKLEEFFSKNTSNAPSNFSEELWALKILSRYFLIKWNHQTLTHNFFLVRILCQWCYSKNSCKWRWF